MKAYKTIYACSDAIGETAEAVARATMRQFPGSEVRLKRYGHIRSEEEIVHIVREAAETGGFIAFTLVQPELREMMKEEALRCGVPVVDVMGPMMQTFIDVFNGYPKRQPGLLHALDEDYFRRIEAMEFAVKFDDGKDARGLLQAQVVLVGVSRTSKTPLSIFLAHKGIKVANFPIIPEVKVPEELDPQPGRLIVGLTMKPDHMINIRKERLKAMGLPPASQYTSLERIHQELEYAAKIMERVQARVIDVTDRSIEETAGIVTTWLSELNRS